MEIPRDIIDFDELSLVGDFSESECLQMGVQHVVLVQKGGSQLIDLGLSFGPPEFWIFPRAFELNREAFQRRNHHAFSREGVLHLARFFVNGLAENIHGAFVRVGVLDVNIRLDRLFLERGSNKDMVGIGFAGRHDMNGCLNSNL